jgi:hypothetical protein
MSLHVPGGIRLCECSTEGLFSEHRKRQRVIVLRLPNPNRRLHQATSLSRCLVAAHTRALRPLSAVLKPHRGSDLGQFRDQWRGASDGYVACSEERALHDIGSFSNAAGSGPAYNSEPQHSKSQLGIGWPP